MINPGRHTTRITKEKSVMIEIEGIVPVAPKSTRNRLWYPRDVIIEITSILEVKSLGLSHQNDEGLRSRGHRLETVQDPEMQGQEVQVLTTRGDMKLMTTYITLKMLHHNPKVIRQIQRLNDNKVQRLVLKIPHRKPDLGR
jgi:hypothetical protein